VQLAPKEVVESNVRLFFTIDEISRLSSRPFDGSSNISSNRNLLVGLFHKSSLIKNYNISKNKNN